MKGLREGSGGEDPVGWCPGGGAWEWFGTDVVSLWVREVEGSEEEPSVEEMLGVSWEGWVDILREKE